MLVPWGPWPPASRDAVSGPRANATVWERSRLESQVAERMPSHQQSCGGHRGRGQGWGPGGQCGVTRRLPGSSRAHWGHSVSESRSKSEGRCVQGLAARFWPPCCPGCCHWAVTASRPGCGWGPNNDAMRCLHQGPQASSSLEVPKPRNGLSASRKDSG